MWQHREVGLREHAAGVSSVPALSTPGFSRWVDHVWIRFQVFNFLKRFLGDSPYFYCALTSQVRTWILQTDYVYSW